MKASLNFTRQALKDFDEISAYIARSNPTRAKSFIDELYGQCLELTKLPFAGPARPDLGPDIRMVVYYKYLILYTMRNNKIHVRRIVHGARDLSRMLH